MVANFNFSGQTFDVVDSWVDPDDASNSNQVPVPLIKKEKDIEEELKDSEKSKKESSSSRRDGSDSRNRDPRTRPSEKGKENGRSNSPGQKRQATAPRSNPARRSPPRKFSPRRNFPRNSPPRRNMPRNNGKQTFLEEMIHKFPEFRNQPNQVPQYNMPNAYGQQMQMQMQPSFMNQPNFIGHQNYMQPLPPGIVMDPYASTMQQFPIMNPMMMGIPGVNPLPVPAPIPVEIPPPIQLFSPLAAQNVPPGQPKKSAQRVISLEKAKAKVK